VNITQLFENIRRKRSFLCVGLDTEIKKIPKFISDLEFPVFEFNKKIIEETANYAVAFKPNLAFYETIGAAGWINLQMTVDYLRKNHPDIFIIADAKRGDIGNTSKMYAKALLQEINFDAITVAPYMGRDSVEPFLSIENKWTILLILTSNEGAADFQLMVDKDSNTRLFELVMKKAMQWGTTENMMFVVGATKADMLVDVRKIAPDHFLLIPGIGAQGGSLDDVVKYGLNKHCGLLVNSSRNIIYADATNNFAKVAGEKASEIQKQMELLLIKYKLI
jgi:orotidine-5'-phosphate decarboxylase